MSGITCITLVQRCAKTFTCAAVFSGVRLAVAGTKLINHAARRTSAESASNLTVPFINSLISSVTTPLVRFATRCQDSTYVLATEDRRILIATSAGSSGMPPHWAVRGCKCEEIAAQPVQ